MKQFILVIMFACFFIGCFGNHESPDLVFSIILDDPDQKRNLDDLIIQFGKLNKCKIALNFYNEKNDCRDIISSLTSQNPPDVILINSLDAHSLYKENLIKTFDKKEFYFNGILSNVKLASFSQDKSISLPWLVDTDLLFINNKLLKQKNRDRITLDELEIITDEVNNPPNCYGFGLPVDSPSDCTEKLISFLLNTSESFVIPEIASTRLLVSAERYLGLGRSGLYETQRKIDYLFCNGKIAACIAGCELEKKLQYSSLDYSVMLYPQSMDSVGRSLLKIKSFVLSAKSKNGQLSNKLISYLTEKSNTL